MDLVIYTVRSVRCGITTWRSLKLGEASVLTTFPVVKDETNLQAIVRSILSVAGRATTAVEIIGF